MEQDNDENRFIYPFIPRKVDSGKSIITDISVSADLETSLKDKIINGLLIAMFFGGLATIVAISLGI